MDADKKSSAKCGDVLHKGSSFLSFISMLLIVALFLRMESINRKTEMNELRITNVERRSEIRSPHTTDHKDELEKLENAEYALNVMEARHHKKRRDAAAQTQTSPKISLQQIHTEINKVCTPPGKICQVGPQGPPGDKGAHGYPGYKGEKGAPGIPGPQGPLGPTGGQGPTGSQGPQGTKGIKGEIGEKGPVGSPGKKGDVGPMGRKGVKGSIGFKGNKGYKGSTGLQGPKGECIISPKINVYPVSLDVFIIKEATFYCWVDGQRSKRITWSKLGGGSLASTSSDVGVLRFNKVQRSHVGSYMCTVHTGYGILRAISSLRIKDVPSCEEALVIANQKLPDGEYLIRNGNFYFPVYCDMASDGKGWTLIARFSNNDNKNWMRDNGYLWYDQQLSIGTTTNPFINTDMISPAFWLVSGREFKITRSDDPSHTPLLQTTGNCLAGQTFRSKITSYGDFRNGKVWASDKCLGSCTVQYGGQYKSTDGFQQAECSGNIQSNNKIGFWCDWDAGDGSVMMIGGGGKACERADHGIGITEADAASFVEPGSSSDGTEYDFGDQPGGGYSSVSAASQSYSLNLWIR